jgi:hypothetical protein
MSLWVAIVALLDLALIAGVVFVMSSPSRLTKHRPSLFESIAWEMEHDRCAPRHRVAEPAREIAA